jgi:hypothetical protein
MKRESLATRVENLEARLESVERRHRRLQGISLFAIALLACALYAQRGMSEVVGRDVAFGEITARKLNVGTIVVSKDMGDDTCNANGKELVCITGDLVSSPKMWTGKISTPRIESRQTLTTGLYLQTDDGQDAGGNWIATGSGKSQLMIGDSQTIRFKVNSDSDPVLTVAPISGKIVTVPVQPR